MNAQRAAHAAAGTDVEPSSGCGGEGAHPPTFITERCQGKEVGDHCSLMILPGECAKGGTRSRGRVRKWAGRYHGKFGFGELAHRRSVMCRATRFDSSTRYPPYMEGNL